MLLCDFQKPKMAHLSPLFHPCVDFGMTFTPPSPASLKVAKLDLFLLMDTRGFDQHVLAEPY